jgi:predicted unusual protein kinase regulating ubiquinone biosynthesis (AarF/ABC1/UbiB family)
VDVPGFVPDELRQLLRFVPTRGWDAVAWRPMLGSLRALSWRYVSGRGVTKLSRALSSRLPDVKLGPADPDLPDLPALASPEERRLAGDRLLRLYFTQWLNPDGVFIDLRSGRFHVEDDCLRFTPNGLWLQVRPTFREGLVALYRAFYSEDEAALEDALQCMGMLSEELDADEAEQLKTLLRAHFGLETGAQRFSIDRFKTSFDALFDFFVDHGISLHPDFVVLGFNLITLYLTLEALGEAHDVQGLCVDVLGKDQTA